MRAASPTTLAGCRVGVAGLGLIGGSLALALRGRCAEVVGCDRSRATLARAWRAGALDRCAPGIERLLYEVDFAVLALPVGGILEALERLRHYDGPPVHLMDVGSSKRAIVRAMASLPPAIRPIGGHPMCGKASAGFAHAEAALFRGRPFVLVPLPRTPHATLRLARSLVRAVGARPLTIPAARHDRAAARISHVPYLLAAALVDTARKDAVARRIAATGFRDLTRVAASDPAMMLDVLRSNRGAVRRALQALNRTLEGYARALERNEARALAHRLRAARWAKRRWFR